MIQAQFREVRGQVAVGTVSRPNSRLYDGLEATVSFVMCVRVRVRVCVKGNTKRLRKGCRQWHEIQRQSGRETERWRESKRSAA